MPDINPQPQSDQPTRGGYLDAQVARQVGGQNPQSPGDYVQQQTASPTPPAAPGAPPQASTSFDVNQNPADKQAMVDSMMYAPMLKEMNTADRAQHWPGIVSALNQVNPKAGGMLDPTLPPSDKDLDAMLNVMPKPKEAEEPWTAADIDPSKASPSVDTSDMPHQDFIIHAMQGAQDFDKVLQASSDPIIKSNLAYQAAKLAAVVGNQVVSGLKGAANAVGEALLPSAQAATITPDGDPNLQGGQANRYMNQPYNVRAGQSVIPGSPEDKPFDSKQEAGGMLSVCKAQLDGIKNALWNRQTGELNGQTIINAAMLNKSPVAAGRLDPVAGKLNDVFANCSTAVARGQGGARFPSKEVINGVREQITPKPGDSPDQVLQKYIFLNASVNTQLAQMHTNNNQDLEAGNARADANYNLVQLHTLDMKDDFMAKCLQQNPSAPYQACQNLWTKSVLESPTFVKNLNARLNSK